MKLNLKMKYKVLIFQISKKKKFIIIKLNNYQFFHKAILILNKR
jgi:hypothetical protein